MSGLIPPSKAEFALAGTMAGRTLRVLTVSLNNPNQVARYVALGAFWTHPALKVRAVGEAGRPLPYGELVVIVREKE